MDDGIPFLAKLLLWVRAILGGVCVIWFLASDIPWLAAGTVITFILPDAIGSLIFIAMMIYAFWTGHVWVGTAIAAYGGSLYVVVSIDSLVQWLYHRRKERKDREEKDQEDQKEKARPIDILIRQEPPPPLPTKPWLRETSGPRWYAEGLTSAGKHFVSQHAPKQPFLYLGDFNEEVKNSKLKYEFAPCVQRPRPL